MNAKAPSAGQSGTHKARTASPAASYRAALAPTAITGASAVVVLALQMVRSKVIAVLLGPSGIGLFGVLTSAAMTVAMIVGMGLSASGARQVAAAVATASRDHIARAVHVLRRTSIVLGLLGGVILLTASRPLARLTIGSDEFSGSLAVLGLLVLFRTVSGSQAALLRGFRQIGDLARLRIWGAVLGTSFAVPLVWIWGLDGVAPAIAAAAGGSAFVSWSYARRIRVGRVRLSIADFGHELSGLLGLGSAFVVSGVLVSSTTLAMRSILARTLDLAAVGQFQAAVGLSVVYVDFILQAMGLDFLPRLTGAVADNAKCNRLVNEQSEISMLLAGPGILAILVVAPVAIPLLYSGSFGQAVGILRWQCLGVLLRVATWPVGYVLQARGEARVFAVTEGFAHIFHLFVFWWLTRVAGLTGASFALAILYAVHLPLILMVVRHYTGFCWTGDARRVLLTVLGGYAAVMTVESLLAPPWGSIAGGLIVVVLAAFSYRELSQRVETPLAAAVFARIRSAAGDPLSLLRGRSRRNEGDEPSELGS